MINRLKGFFKQKQESRIGSIKKGGCNGNSL